MIHPRTTILAAFTLVAGAALIAACSSSSTTTTTNTAKDGGISGDTDSGSSGDVDGGGGGTDSGGGGTDSGGGGGSDAGAGETCPGPTGGQGGCGAGLECEAFPSKGGNYCTKACTDPGNATSADCAGNAAFTGKCTPNSYCQLK